jgi:hypothetical protein
MRAARLKWCQDHAHWTLDDWKKVIWTDETSVVLNFRRGGYRVWRTAKEAFVKSNIRERWKGYSEFMFWGSYTYDYKGPFHMWKPETAKEKKQSVKDLERWNKELEPLARAEWELNTPMRRLGLRNRPGVQPKWKWCAETGKLARGRGSGIDWYRYQTQVMVPKLIPFAQRLGPDFIVQEDNAPAHAHHAQAPVYSVAGVKKLLWCPNSPDLNMIEPAWWYLKTKTTKWGAPKSRKEAERVWAKEWKDLDQRRIQAFVERIVRHVRIVIECNGGNEYKEGREKEVPVPDAAI